MSTVPLPNAFCSCPPPVDEGCCMRPLPAVLTGTLVAGAPPNDGCACIEGSFAMVWQPENQRWYGEYEIPSGCFAGGKTLAFWMTCDAMSGICESFNAWVGGYNCTGAWTSTPTECTCDPLYVKYTGHEPNHCCYEGPHQSGTFDLVVSE